MKRRAVFVARIALLICIRLKREALRAPIKTERIESAGLDNPRRRSAYDQL